MEGFWGHMITKLRLDGSVRGKPVKRTGEELRKGKATCHNSEVRGQLTIQRLGTEKGLNHWVGQSHGGKDG